MAKSFKHFKSTVESQLLSVPKMIPSVRMSQSFPSSKGPLASSLMIFCKKLSMPNISLTLDRITVLSHCQPIILVEMFPTSSWIFHQDFTFLCGMVWTWTSKQCMLLLLLLLLLLLPLLIALAFLPPHILLILLRYRHWEVPSKGPSLWTAWSALRGSVWWMESTCSSPRPPWEPLATEPRSTL